jgi:hypothetical protein
MKISKNGQLQQDEEKKNSFPVGRTFPLSKMDKISIFGQFLYIQKDFWATILLEAWWCFGTPGC